MADRNEIITEIEALEVHCRLPLMSVEQRGVWMRDWADDLGEYPIEAIRMACRDWRQGGERKFPTPGQLLPLVRAKIARKHEDGDNKPWEPLSDLAYNSLTLREKIRHQNILYQQALAKGGPQWRNGKPVAAEDMPPEWHAARALARNFADEAARLQGKLKIASQTNAA